MLMGEDDSVRMSTDVTSISICTLLVENRQVQAYFFRTTAGQIRALLGPDIAATACGNATVPGSGNWRRPRVYGARKSWPRAPRMSRCSLRLVADDGDATLPSDYFLRDHRGSCSRPAPSDQPRARRSHAACARFGPGRVAYRALCNRRVSKGETKTSIGVARDQWTPSYRAARRSARSDRLCRRPAWHRDAMDAFRLSPLGG